MAPGYYRFTVFSLNPNDVATFIVVLILSLPVLLRLAKWMIWFVWPLEVLLLALLVGTGSRGGGLALLLGGLFGLIFVRRNINWPVSWKWLVCAGLSIVIGVGAGLLAFPKGGRLTDFDASSDSSAGRRLETWSYVPTMLATAPQGWGWERSGDAFGQWFQPADENVVLQNLLSSHLSWYTEFGWPLRCAYVFLWLAALRLLVPEQKLKFPGWGLAVGAAFFIALFWNPSGKWWNWPVPLLWVLAAITSRWRHTTFPPFAHWIFIAFFSGCLTALPVFRSGGGSPVPLQAEEGGDLVKIGAGEPTLAVLAPNKNVLGNLYGHDIRRNFLEKGKSAETIAVVLSPSNRMISSLSKCRTYVFSGQTEETLNDWLALIPNKNQSKLMLINCRVPAGEWVGQFAKISYWHGSFYGDPYFTAWQALASANPNISANVLPRCGAYVSNWYSLSPSDR